MFGEQRLDELLVGCDGRPPSTCIQRLLVAPAAFSANAPPADDQTLIAIRYG